MKKIFLKIIMTFYNIIYALRSLFWKRDKSIVLFGSWFGMKFADNPRYLYQFLYKNKDKYHLSHVVWVTWNKNVHDEMCRMGYEVYMMDSKESIYYHKKAYIHFACDGVNGYGNMKCELLGQYSYGAKRVNLWHGVGNKAIGFGANSFLRYASIHPLKAMLRKDIQKSSFLFRNFIYDIGGWGNCYFCAPSDDAIKNLQNELAFKKNRFIKCGYSRNCECIRLMPDEQRTIELIKQYDKTVLYLPTFRMGCEQFDVTNVADKVDDIIRDNNVLWIQKAHTADSENQIVSQKKGNVLNLDTNFDINVIMPYIDLLVTDYSSCYSDAMYHNKPIIFYIPDIDSYKEGSNGFIRNPEDVMCGLKAFNIKELRNCLIKGILNPAECMLPMYDEVREREWEKERSMEEIWDEISQVVLKNGSNNIVIR